jgi:subtilase family serine protease
MRNVCRALSLVLSAAFVIASSTAAGASQKASANRILQRPLGAHSIVPHGRRRSGASLTLCKRPQNVKRASCFASANVDATVPGAFPDAVYGLTPSDLSLLYAYPAPGNQGSAGAAQTVAVVVAYDYANAEQDLGVYRQYYGLPPCTTANGCLSKVGAAAAGWGSQSGSPSSVSANPTGATALGWAAETDIDTQMVSAVCPNCNIVIAEAASDNLSDLANAVNAAVASGATIVNASFGAPEDPLDAYYAPAFENSHVKVVAAAGDWGFGVYYPAADDGTVAVGGTSLQVSGTQVSESVWNGTGSGCSRYFPRMPWQRNLGNGWSSCRSRTVADVSAVADPDTGVSVYDSSLFGSYGGWTVAGGTSVAAPIITGLYALSGDTNRDFGAQELYGSRWAFAPVTSGSNGWCALAYLCTAQQGYSGPAGIGVPQGLAGF